MQARGNVDYVNDKFRQKYYASTAPALAGNNGRYIDSGNEQVQTYGDVIGTYKGKFNDFSLDVSLGASINRKKVNELRYDSKTASLKFANVFNIANINMNTSAYISEQIDAVREMQSLFVTVQVGFRDYLFLDVSARNDWSSTLAYTTKESRGFFYPSVGLSWLVNRVLKLPEQVTSGKVRATWSKVGNANPDFTLGWTNTFSWKGLVLSLLVDGRYGGKVLSQTQADMDMYGVTKVTGDARDKGYVMLEGQKITNVKGFYKSIVGGRAGVTEYYMYDATNFRLRELALGYTFPKRWMDATKFFRDVQLAFTARNLFFIYKKAPFDPDLILSTGNDNQAIEVYGMPTTRSMGFSLRVMF